MADAYAALAITDRSGAEPAVRFGVRVQPRSSRAGIDGVHGSALKVRVAAPPVDGAANEAVVAVLAKALGIGKRSITIVSGASSRSKLVEVQGLTANALREVFRKLPP